MPDVPPELREFLASRFSSIEQVDVFVLLHRSPERQWSPQDVAGALGVAPQSAGMRLFLLSSAGLLASSGDRDVRYWYAAAPALDDVARVIDDAHRDDRAALAAVFGGPPAAADPAQVFADAFRLKKP
jgi:hypothetical protein